MLRQLRGRDTWAVLQAAPAAPREHRPPLPGLRRGRRRADELRGLSGGGGPRKPPATPGAEERRLGQLLTLGATRFGWELAGALLGGARGAKFETIGLVVTLASATVFAGNLAFVAGRGLWRRWRR